MRVPKVDIVKVPEEWVLSGGNGTRVVVIDSHIDKDSSVFNKVVSYEMLHRQRNSGTSHCTSICSIISKVSPMSEIVVIQALLEKTGTLFGLERALDMARGYEFDVLNLSVSSAKSTDRIKSLISDISKKSIVVCSVPNDGKTSYPNGYEEVISVSSLDNRGYDADMYAEDKFMFSDPDIKKSGNSMSTAFVTGVCLLARSFDRTMLKEDVLKRLLGK